MSKTKKTKSCKPLEPRVSAQLARYIIEQTSRGIDRGVNHRTRIPAPSGTVILF